MVVPTLLVEPSSSPKCPMMLACAPTNLAFIADPWSECKPRYSAILPRSWWSPNHLDKSPARLYGSWGWIWKTWNLWAFRWEGTDLKGSEMVVVFVFFLFLFFSGTQTWQLDDNHLYSWEKFQCHVWGPESVFYDVKICVFYMFEWMTIYGYWWLG